MSNDVEWTVYNLEHTVRALLPDDMRWQPFSEELLAEAIRVAGNQSLILNMALAAALTSDKAAYRLRMAHNTAAYPGGVPQLTAVLRKAETAKSVRSFVDEQVESGIKTEAAIAAAQEKFRMGRSSIFTNLKFGRLLDED